MSRRIPKKMFVMLALVLACGALVLIPPARPPVKFEESVIYVRGSGQIWPFTVELAKRTDEQQLGLMHRENLPDGRGMLFVANPPRVMQMWMKDTLISLDMFFIDSSGKIVHIVEHTEPMSTRLIRYSKPVQAVLEVPAGTAEAKNIRVGDRVVQASFAPLGMQ